MKKKKIVTIGGGTGSFMLLSGLKKFPEQLDRPVIDYLKSIYERGILFLDP